MATPRYADLAQQVLSIRSSAQALLGQTDTLLKTLQPLVDGEQATQAQRPTRPVFGKRSNPTEE